MYVTSLTKNLDATLEIAKEMLFEPAFSKEDFERVKNQRMDAIANQSTQATTIANNVYNKLLYGEDHIMSISALGTKESVNGITLADVTAFYKDNFAPSITRVVVVGEIDKADALKKLAFLNTWSQSSPVRAAEPASPKIDKTRIYMVNKEKAAQSEIRIGYMALPYDATGDYYKATVMNYVLGGAFNSRINLNLREAHGFTYGARSSFSGTRFAGPFTAAAGVRTNATDSSVIEFMKELKLYSDKGITAEELKFTQSSIGQGEALKYESPMQKAGFLSRIQDYNLGKDFVIKQNEILNSATPDMINQLAKKHLPLDKLIILVVGDKSMIYDGLVKTGYEVIELDADGNPVAAIAEKATEEKVEQKSPEQNSGKERAKGVRVTERKK
jgi:zinc protease